MQNLSMNTMKRLKGDYKLFKKNPHPYVDAFPDPKNVLNWYFMIKGPEDSHYKGGYYLGMIMHDKEYPIKPPDFMMLTPSGRFIADKKICMTNSGYHLSDWSPMWTTQAILIGFLSIMVDDVDKGISHILRSKEEREYLAKQSISFNKAKYPGIIKKFKRFIDEDGNPLS